MAAPASQEPEMRKSLFAVIGLALMSGALMAQDADPYKWLEDVHGEKALDWVRQTNAESLAELKADPRYQDHYDTILALLDATDRIPTGSINRNHVHNFWQDAKNPKGLWRRTTIADYANPSPNWETLLDVDALAASEKENWVFKGADCSPHYMHCLVSLSRGGGDAVVVREFDLASRAFVANGFTLKEAKTDATWIDDNTILFATDFGPDTLTDSGYARIVKRWTRGTPVSEAKTIYEGKKADVIVAPFVAHGPKGDTPFVVRAVSFFESEIFYVEADGTTKKVPLPLSADVKGVVDGNLIATLREDWTQSSGPVLAKGALIVFPLDNFLKGMPSVAAAIYTPGPRSSIDQVATGDGILYATIFENVTGTVHAFRPSDTGWSDKTLALPPGGSPGIVSVNDYGPEAYFMYQNYLTPPTLYADSGSDVPSPIKSLPARFEASGMVTEQFEATSADGTKIPYFVTRPKTMAGPAPTILYGYGGFEISLTPGYSANFGKLWVAQGGLYVVANIRGGGEFGPAWHDAALKENRQRAFDDFAAVAADLIARKLTTPAQLGIMGGSNGGLLVSTVMTQHPELLGAVVCQVPLIDMLGYTGIGAGASWEGEYGDPADPKMRAAIEKYSPYQNVSADKTYPPVFFVTATSDDRVTPVHARKMAAKMLAQGHDVLFFENTDGGHSAAADHKQSAEMWGLSFVYLKRKLGLN